MRPLEFYRLGVSLSETAISEPLQRTVVNRLYYGLHHEACCRYFRTNPPTEPPLNRNRRHVELHERYNSQDDATSRNVGNLLNDLRRFRTLADYELVPPLRLGGMSLDAQALFNLALSTAQQLLDALEEYSPGEAEDGCDCPQAFMSS